MSVALRTLILALAAGLSSSTAVGLGQDRVLHTFERQQLIGTYFSEGANAGDINSDGHLDVVYGPYWFAGPSFQTKHEIYPAKPQPMDGYANNFFSWVADFSGDGHSDVLVVGFPGTPAFVYENPGDDHPGDGGRAKHWSKHQVLDSVSNESPQLVNLIGDERPELVCTHDGFFGFATIDWENGLKPWAFHAISEQIAPKPFGHGLGVGDVNGDGRMDILQVEGWFEQPAENPTGQRWKLHRAKFSPSYGGAEMYAYDVDGDGDNDVITSLAAHDFGLAWFEQTEPGQFEQRTIMGSLPEHSRYGLVFSEPHSVALVDMDGDGLKDIVTGKTYWSHHRKSPQWDAGPVVYWFKLVRGKDGVDWVPYKIDDRAGIGRQVSIADLNSDGLPDIVVGGMLGAHVLLHQAKAVDKARWLAAQPKVFTPPELAAARFPKLDPKTGRVAGAIEGEALRVEEVTAGRVTVQNMSSFSGGRWSGNEHLWWTEGQPGAKLQLTFAVEKDGTYEVFGALTKAVNYATVQLRLNDEVVIDSLDLFDPVVINTGELSLGKHMLRAGEHRLTIEITGANPAALKEYMVGLDYLRLVAQ